MKSILLFLVLPTLVYCQNDNRYLNRDFFYDSVRVLSNYEKFTNTPGVVHKTQQRPLGSTRNILVSLFTTIDPITRESASAIKLTYENVFYTNPFSEGLYIDIDEAEEVGKILKYYYNEIRNDNGSRQSALSYITKNDISVNAWSERSGTWYITLQQCYHNTVRPIGGIVLPVKVRDLDDLAELMIIAKSRVPVEK